MMARPDCKLRGSPCFLFSKVSLWDLVSQPKDAAKLDRMFVLFAIWQARHITTQHSRPPKGADIDSADREKETGSSGGVEVCKILP